MNKVALSEKYSFQLFILNRELMRVLYLPFVIDSHRYINISLDDRRYAYVAI